MITAYVAFPALRSFARKLLTLLALLDFISVIGRFLPFFALQDWRDLNDESAVCIAETGIIVFSDCASFIVTAAIAIYAYQQVMLDSALAKIKNFAAKLQFYLLVSMIYPIAWVAFIFCNKKHSSHKDDFGCWITEEQPGVRFGSTYGPLWVSWVICIYSYCRIFLRLRAVTAAPGLRDTCSERAVSLLSTKRHTGAWQRCTITEGSGEEDDEDDEDGEDDEDDEELDDALARDAKVCTPNQKQVDSNGRSNSIGRSKILPAKLIFVPLIFVFVHIWGSINAVQDLSGTKKKNFVLLLESVNDPAQGFWNGLIYAVLSPQVHVQVKAALGRCTSRPESAVEV
jgi:hypothetical protein